MKRILFLTMLLIGMISLITLSCNRESAVKQLMADPQMSQMIMQKMWETPQTKQQLVEKVMNDPESMNKIKESLTSDPNQAALMMDLMLAKEDLKGMITEKTVNLHQVKK